jgi:uncharacterized protein
MKIAFILIAVLVGVWLFRSSRRAKPQAKSQAEPAFKRPATSQLEMVRCLHCDLHLPKSDAVTGRRGIYCSQEHRQHSES